jgi:Flp pilus assembly pilin Flp
MTMMRALKRLVRENEGSMAIETAVVASSLALLSLGSFQVSSLVARQNELQGAAAEAAAIALAAKPDTTAKLNTLESILMTSTGLPDSQISVAFRYKCGTDNDLERNSACDDDDDEQEWKFVRVRLRDTYQPIWAQYGIGSTINLKVERLVQIQ